MTAATRTRINVYTSFGDESPVLAGHFIRESARRWEQDWDCVNRPDRGAAVLRTAHGRWVKEHWTCWQGERDSYEYITAEQAHEWLLANHHDDAVTEFFGPIEEERGPGRPEVGPAINVRLGDDRLGQVDTWAVSHGKSRAEAIRHLLDAGLDRA